MSMLYRVMHIERPIRHIRRTNFAYIDLKYRLSEKDNGSVHPLPIIPEINTNFVISNGAPVHFHMFEFLIEFYLI